MLAREPWAAAAQLRFEHDGLSNWRGWGALPYALRAWQRWLLPATLTWI
jgi:hypothetical protein